MVWLDLAAFGALISSTPLWCPNSTNDQPRNTHPPRDVTMSDLVAKLQAITEETAAANLIDVGSPTFRYYLRSRIR
jgi:hypothetical protein